MSKQVLLLHTTFHELNMGFALQNSFGCRVERNFVRSLVSLTFTCAEITVHPSPIPWFVHIVENCNFWLGLVSLLVQLLLCLDIDIGLIKVKVFVLQVFGVFQKHLIKIASCNWTAVEKVPVVKVRIWRERERQHLCIPQVLNGKEIFKSVSVYDFMILCRFRGSQIA